QTDPADDPERRGVVLYPVDELDDLLDRRAGEHMLQLLDEEGVRLRAVREAEERERQEDEGYERQKREVRDHRGEVGAAILEELVHELAPTDAHGCRVCTLIPSERWTRPLLSPISSRSRRRSRRLPWLPATASSPARWAFPSSVRAPSHVLSRSFWRVRPRSAATRVGSRSCTQSSWAETCSPLPKASVRSSRS